MVIESWSPGEREEGIYQVEFVFEKLHGLIAATCTPFDRAGNVETASIAPLVDRLIGSGVNGLYVCGSTGEGLSLSVAERQQVAKAYVEASAGRVPVVIQVGHNSVAEARRLAEHAASIGANAISATCPSYFKVTDTLTLVRCMDEISSVTDLPFYYYHIPSLTGSMIDMPEFLAMAADQIDKFCGLKYTDTKLFEFQECLELQDGKFDVVWGCDEMLLGALATGTHAAIGSTYNIAAPLYRRIIDSVDRGDWREARKLQSRSVAMVRVLCHYPFHAALKATLEMQGLSLGGCRMPLRSLSPDDSRSLQAELQEIGFFDWSASTS